MDPKLSGKARKSVSAMLDPSKSRIWTYSSVYVENVIHEAACSWFEKKDPDILNKSRKLVIAPVSNDSSDQL